LIHTCRSVTQRNVTYVRTARYVTARYIKHNVDIFRSYDMIMFDIMIGRSLRRYVKNRAEFYLLRNSRKNRK